MKKKTDTPLRLCWDCAFSKPDDNELYRTPEGGPIFYRCYYDPSNVKRGLMYNTVACSQFKERRVYGTNH